MKHTLSLIALVAASPAFSDGTRQLDAHEHGVGALNIAVEGTTVAMEFHAPGADIVGFEYAAESDADLAAIETAIATLNAPLDLFVMPEDAACTVTAVNAELENEDEHKDHDDHDHDEHAEEDHEHEDHDHEEHAEEGQKDQDHEEHSDHAGHTEFHAEYTLSCENTDALNQINFVYFDAFPNAKEVEVQMITAAGAHSFEVEREAPVLELEH